MAHADPTPTTATTDPTETVRRLSVDDISARLDDLHAEEAALRVLLRAARARERVRASATRDDDGRR